jgi:protein-tyrosine phosphatase
LPFITLEYSKGKNILVHCLAGNQRSAAFVCAFLMNAKKFTLDEAIKYLLEKKPNVFFFGRQNNFINALQNIEDDIKKNKII